PALGCESAVREEAECLPVECVSAGWGDDVDDATQRTAELGLVSAAPDLDLLDEIVRKVGAPFGEIWIRHVDPIDEVYVFRPRPSRDVGLVPVVAGVCLRSQGDHGSEVPVGGPRLQLPGGPVRPG